MHRSSPPKIKMHLIAILRPKMLDDAPWTWQYRCIMSRTPRAAQPPASNVIFSCPRECSCQMQPQLSAAAARVGLVPCVIFLLTSSHTCSWNKDMGEFFQDMPGRGTSGVYANIYDDLDTTPVAWHISEVANVLSVCQSVTLSLCHSANLCICLCIFFPVSACQYVCVSGLCLYIYLRLCLLLCVCLCVCLYRCLCLFPCLCLCQSLLCVHVCKWLCVSVRLCVCVFIFLVGLCVCVFIFIVCLCLCLSLGVWVVCVYVSVCQCVSVSAYQYVRLWEYAHVCGSVIVWSCMCVCVRVCVCFRMYVCVCACF